MALKRKIRFRYGAAADRPTLSTGEIGLDTDTGSETLYVGTPAGNKSLTTLALPSQTSNSGKYLTTDGSTASWGTVSTTVKSALSFALDENLANGTRYQTPGSGLAGTVNNRWSPVPFACTVSRLAVRANANTGTTTFTVYKNNQATSVTVQLTAGVTSNQDSSNTVSFSAYDEISLVIVNSGGACFYPSAMVQLTAT